MIRALIARARDYVLKMQLQADIVGWELDLYMARRQANPMPELEELLEEEIRLARAMVASLNAKHQTAVIPMVPAAELDRAASRISRLEQRLHDARIQTAALFDLVDDDGHAATFQSIGQYRSAIKRSIAGGAK